ncbi:MAG: WecB/TagA/CpsF family glycosyltransferase [Candidatus Peribacteria bacterium]|jgi:N-acetylglucosaminyldiphosphoundecaprenol N-acetyl-beta-D-mannosaminyltransferase|nr:WecB/TagA/CpsF family glycosyltransferase [Candidatus Peribacteria bacterium]
MKSILTKFYTGTAPQLVDDLLDTYQDQHFAVVNFLYFAQIVSQALFSDTKQQTEKHKEYKKILLKADYLLPDGIALQIFYYLANFFRKIHSPRPRLTNLNGTDFTPYFLNEVKKKYGNQKICLLLYGTTPKGIEKSYEYIAHQGFNVIYFQDGYREFVREEAIKKLDEYQDTINILLVGRSTPNIPLQELRTLRNYQKIRSHQLLVMNVGGFFDRRSGSQKRAPKLVRKLKLERLRRVITQPKRNIKKVLQSFQLFPYIFRYLIGKKG